MVVPEGIEPNCRHPAYYGNGFTVRRREQEPYPNTLDEATGSGTVPAYLQCAGIWWVIVSPAASPCADPSRTLVHVRYKPPHHIETH